MRQIYLYLALVAQFSLYGQTIDNTWFLQPGTTYTTLNNFDDEVADLNIVTGEDVTWNFGRYRETNLMDTVFVVEPSEASFGELYPDATVVRVEHNPFYDWEYYYKATPDTLYKVSSVGIRKPGIPDTIYLEALENQSWEMIDGYSFGDTLWESVFLVTNKQFLGTGKLITPSQDTFENCVLFKQEFPQAGAVEYVWYKDNLDIQIAIYKPQQTGLSGSLRWVNEILESRSDVSADNSISVMDRVVVTYQDGSIKITNNGDTKNIVGYLFSSSGQLIQRFNVRSLAGTTHLEDLPRDMVTGIYNVIIEDKATRQFQTSRFFVR